MEIKKKNSNIHCSVTQCKHNMVSENYCGLDCIVWALTNPTPLYRNAPTVIPLSNAAAQSAEHAYRRIFPPAT